MAYMEKTGCMVQCEKHTDADAFLKEEYSLVNKPRKYITIRNMLREFLVVIAAVAKVLCRQGLWLVTCVKSGAPDHSGVPLLSSRGLTPVYFLKIRLK